MSKQRLLYVSPVVPVLQGTGLALRAGVVLEALDRDYQVDLLVLPVNEGPSTIPDGIQRLSDRSMIIELPDLSGADRSLPRKSRFATPELLSRVTDAVRGETYDVVHVFRLYTIPYAAPLLDELRSQGVRRWLDLDDFQSEARAEVADAAEAMGDIDAAAAERSDVARYIEMERHWLERFDRVYVSNRHDQLSVRNRYRLGNVFLLPNAVRLPTAVSPTVDDGAIRLLFVGTLNYPPNEEGALFFCSHVLPELRRRTKRPFRIVVAGHRPSQRVQALEAHPEVRVTGNVDDIGCCYERADIAIVPLRFGGGTRIKVMEAAGYRKVIVSTDVGVKGLAVQHGDELLVANTADEFARCCLRLMDEPELRNRLEEAAYRWVCSSHTIEVVRQSLRYAP